MLSRAAPPCWVLICVASLTGCSFLRIEPRPVRVKHDTVYTTSGLRFEDLADGDGPSAVTGDQVTFDYTAWLEDETRVDSTLDRGVPITVTLGTAELACMNEGLLGMQPHGRRRLIVPPELAYGVEGVEGLIPSNATLIFEVHVLEVVRR
jgi:FKBP-type peptidyl-prolyl cis-trans isomerase